MRPEDGSAVLAGVDISHGIVLNQSCDVTGEGDRLKPLLISRVRPITDVKPNFLALAPDRRVKDVIKPYANPGRNPTAFYLPPFEVSDFVLPASTVDLLDTMRFPGEEVRAIAGLRRARLSHSALQSFQERLAYCFGRFGAPDDLFFTDEEAAAIRPPKAAP